MPSHTRRPASVWIAQIIILLVGLAFSFIVLLTFSRELVFLAGGNLGAVQWLWFLVSVILRIAILLLFFFAFLGLAKRRPYGRWLSVASISLVVVLSIFGQIYRPKGPFEYQEYENSAQWMGGMFANVIIYGLLAFLLYRLAFGENVSDFFSMEQRDTSNHPPPPNAYFNEPGS